MPASSAGAPRPALLQHGVIVGSQDAQRDLRIEDEVAVAVDQSRQQRHIAQPATSASYPSGRRLDGDVFVLDEDYCVGDRLVSDPVEQSIYLDRQHLTVPRSAGDGHPIVDTPVMLMGVRVPRVMATVAMVAILGGCDLHILSADSDPGGCHPPPMVHVLVTGTSGCRRKDTQVTAPARANPDQGEQRLLGQRSSQPVIGRHRLLPADAQITTLYVLWVPCDGRRRTDTGVPPDRVRADQCAAPRPFGTRSLYEAVAADPRPFGDLSPRLGSRSRVEPTTERLAPCLRGASPGDPTRRIVACSPTSRPMSSMWRTAGRISCSGAGR